MSQKKTQNADVGGSTENVEYHVNKIMGSRRSGFWIPRKMSKKCQMDIPGGSQMDPQENIKECQIDSFEGQKWDPRKMSNRCRNDMFEVLYPK